MERRTRSSPQRISERSAAPLACSRSATSVGESPSFRARSSTSGGRAASNETPAWSGGSESSSGSESHDEPRSPRSAAYCSARIHFLNWHGSTDG